MSDQQKIRAFNLMASGEVAGMSIFWREFNKIINLSDYNVLEVMARCACEEAIGIAIEEEENEIR